MFGLEARELQSNHGISVSLVSLSEHVFEAQGALTLNISWYSSWPVYEHCQSDHAP